MSPFWENDYDKGRKDGLEGTYKYDRRDDDTYNAGFESGYYEHLGINEFSDKEAYIEAKRKAEEYKDNSYYAGNLFGAVNFTTVQITAILKALLALVFFSIISLFSSCEDGFKSKNNPPSKINHAYQQNDFNNTQVAQNSTSTLSEEPNRVVEDVEDLNYGSSTQSTDDVKEQKEDTSIHFPISNPVESPITWNSYMSEVERTIKMNWTPPDEAEGKVTIVRFKIAKDGRLLYPKILESSGVQSADTAAIDAIQSTAPFKPLPSGFKGESVDIQFTFDYHKVE